jgi:transcriptional regulator CtsR
VEQKHGYSTLNYTYQTLLTEDNNFAVIRMIGPILFIKLDSVKNNDYISQLTLEINSKFMEDSEEMIKKTVDNLVTKSLIRKDLYVTQNKNNSIKFKLSPAD